MKKFCLILVSMTSLTAFGAAMGPTRGDVEVSLAAGETLWVSVPEYKDSVLAKKDPVRGLIYVHPSAPNTPLPKGLFVWKGKQEKFRAPGKRTTVAAYVPGSNRRFFWHAPSKGYVAFYRDKIGDFYDPSKARYWDPSRAVAFYREQLLRAKDPRAKAPRAKVSPLVGPKVPPPPGAIDRNTLFKDIMGITEDEFKAKIAGRRGDSSKKPRVPDVNRAFQELVTQGKLSDRALLAVEGEFSTPTLAALRKQVLPGLEKSVKAGHVGGSFSLEERRDIRLLHEKYPGAFFQVASNVDALEGGMGDFRNNLVEMNKMPAQGEEASLATMAATINRRYFHPRINFLKNLDRIFELYSVKEKPAPKIKSISKKGFKYADLSGLQVGVHTNISVTSGRFDDQTIDRGDGKMKPLWNKRFDQPIYVSHIFSGAHDLAPWRTPDVKRNPEGHNQAAYYLLRGIYEGTVLAAIASGAKQLILTQMGGGSFRNNPDWIMDAIEFTLPLIAASDIEVKVVGRNPRLKAMQATLESWKKNPEDLRKAFEEYLTKIGR